MEIDTIEVVQLELKYCERCGVLWMRLCGDDEVYCALCRPLLSQSPLARCLRCTWNSDAERQRVCDVSVIGTGGNA